MAAQDGPSPSTSGTDRDPAETLSATQLGRQRPLHWRFRQHRHDPMRFWVPWVGLTLVLLAVGWLLVKPAPPGKVVIATSSKDGAYHWFAEHYAKTLADNGVKLEVRETAGSVENYHLLDSREEQEKGGNGVTLALVQGGTAPEGMAVEIHSIASLYLEPVWVFYRADTDITDMRALRGKRIAIGPDGSGSRAIALRLLSANGVAREADERFSRATTQPTTLRADGSLQTGDETTLLPLGGNAATDALKAGSIDALFLVINPRAPMIADLLRAAPQGVRLMSIARHQAYTRQFPYLTDVTLPRGTIDLEHDLPATDVHLIAPAANLICRADMHPAIVTLLLKAVGQAHERGDLLSPAGVFPSDKQIEFPVDPAAHEYFRSGSPFLYRYLPFWVAAFIDRMKILLLPLITLLIPLSRIAPPLYVWRTRSRIYKWYRVLREVDQRLREDDTPIAPGAQPPNYEREMSILKDMERELAEVKVPLSYMQEFYHLRLHTDFLRRRLQQRMDAAAAPAPDLPGGGAPEVVVVPR